MNRSDSAHMVELLEHTRWGGLATAGEEGPLASMVACVPLPDLSGFVLHLSWLAKHTANLVALPRASLVLSEPDPGTGDPQTLARVTISGGVEAVARDDPRHAALAEAYLSRLPSAEPLFGFGDFSVFVLRADEVNYVGGFARAYVLDPEGLAREVSRGRAARAEGPATA
jgi:hypothetical protein